MNKTSLLNMNKKTAYFLLAIVFVLALGGSFFLTRIMKNGKNQVEVINLPSSEDKGEEPIDTVNANVGKKIPESGKSIQEVSVGTEKEKGNKDIDKEIGIKVKNKINITELNKLIRQGGHDWRKDIRIADNVYVKVVNKEPKEGEIGRDFQKIKDHITLGIWTDFDINGIEYDKDGRVIQVTIRAERPANDNEESIVDENNILSE